MAEVPVETVKASERDKMSNAESGEKRNAEFNALLKKHGIDVGKKVTVGRYDVVIGSVFDDVALDFSVTIPVAYHAVAKRVEALFRDVGLHTHAATWEHLGDGGKELLHIIGTV